MPLTIDTLRNAATRSRVAKARNLTEARAQRLQTLFLCHSHLDEVLVRGLVTLLEESGWMVYVDWADAAMPEQPTRETAARIKQRIVELNFFLFLATANSMSSRWCPWEIGYADGKKPIDQILVVPTTDGIRTHGNEYLQLYRHIDLSTLHHLAAWQPGQTTNGVLLEHL
jgi:hypothetical protein